VRLLDSEDFTGPCLCQTALLDDFVNLQRQPGFQKFLLGIRQPRSSVYVFFLRISVLPSFVIRIGALLSSLLLLSSYSWKVLIKLYDVGPPFTPAMPDGGQRVTFIKSFARQTLGGSPRIHRSVRTVRRVMSLWMTN
jgi:hypothetical protein